MSSDANDARAPEIVYLELSDGQSHKFYEVTVNDTKLTIRYGRIGKAGQSSSTSYTTTEQAQAEAAQKINEKLRKGYRRITLEATDDVPPWLRDLPPEFEPLRPFLEANLMPYIKIQIGDPVGEHNSSETAGDPLPVWQSKIGGNPYFPKNGEYPVDPDSDKAMPLLIQINCADVPPIAGFDFPRQGILQFYLGFEPADADRTPGKYQVLYFPKITTDESHLIGDFSFIEDYHTIRELYPEVYPITFAVCHDLFWEHQQGESMGIPEELGELSAAFGEWLWDYLLETETRIRGTKLGGYVDLHSNTDEIAEAASGRLLLELVHPSYCDDSFLFFITDAQLREGDFSEAEFSFVCD